jgi:hypothetical protein
MSKRKPTVKELCADLASLPNVHGKIGKLLRQKICAADLKRAESEGYSPSASNKVAQSTSKIFRKQSWTK